MKSFHPDDTDMVRRDPRDEKDRDGKGGGSKPPNMLDAFFPGQQGAIARQLNAGFGGGLKNWQQSLGATYAPFRNAVTFPYAKLGGGMGMGAQPGKGKFEFDPATSDVVMQYDSPWVRRG